MSESKSFSVSKLVVVSVLGLSVCGTIVVSVVLTIKSPRQEVATISYVVTRAVPKTIIRTIPFTSHRVAVEGNRVKILPYTRVFKVPYSQCGLVAETRIKEIPVFRASKETVKLCFFCGITLLVGSYYAMLLYACGRYYLTDKKPPKHLSDHVGKISTSFVALVVGFLLAPETPQSFQANIPSQGIQVATSTPYDRDANLPDKLEFFQRALENQKKEFLDALSKLNIDVSVQEDSRTPDSETEKQDYPTPLIEPSVPVSPFRLDSMPSSSQPP